MCGELIILIATRTDGQYIDHWTAFIAATVLGMVATHSTQTLDRAGVARPTAHALGLIHDSPRHHA